MTPFCLLVLLFTCQFTVVLTHCPFIDMCTCETEPSRIICDGNYGNQSDNTHFPAIATLPSVETYIFRNFRQLQSHAFENVTFLSNRSISIYLMNITTISSHAFANSTIIPNDSTLSIDIEQLSITLKATAFHHVSIHRLRFLKIIHFNGRPIFDVDCFGEDLHVTELVFEQSGLTGFSGEIRKTVDVQNLSIRQCPSLTQLTNKSLPTFLMTTKSLEISNTGLQLINSHTFQAWTLTLRELILRNNTQLRFLPTNMIDGILMELETLDLSDNPISVLDSNYNWFTYSYTKHLFLQRQQLDLFLQTNLLKTLGRLRTIDFSGGFIRNNDNNERLIRDYVPSMPNLVSMDVSYTNLTEHMIIDLLTILSRTANRTMKVRLLGHRLHDSDFCSYFTIFQKAPNLLQLELDENHECNCIVDLFYRDESKQLATNQSQIRPTCLSNITRIRCDIENQLTLSKCPVTQPNPGGSGSDVGNIGSYAFIGIMVGLGMVVLLLLGLGSGIVYRVRKARRLTDADMEEPVENPLAAIIEERLQNTQ